MECDDFPASFALALRCRKQSVYINSTFCGDIDAAVGYAGNCKAQRVAGLAPGAGRCAAAARATIHINTGTRTCSFMAIETPLGARLFPPA